jgi:hypothetical protein
LAPGDSTPTEPAPEADATLPDLPPPGLQQGEAGAGGEEHVEAPDAAPADGIGKRLTTHGWLPRPRRYVLKASGLAGAQQPPPEEAVGTSGSPCELLKAEPGYRNVIPTDLVDDPMLTSSNIKTFKQAYKELYDFAMVRPKYFSV